LSISDVMISFVEKNARRTAGIAARIAPADSAGSDHPGDHERRRRTGHQQRDGGARDRTGIELALTADVEEVHAEGRRGSQIR